MKALFVIPNANRPRADPTDSGQIMGACHQPTGRHPDTTNPGQPPSSLTMTVNKDLQHPCPAQAAGELRLEPDTGGNGGETVGDPLVGMGAASANGSQPCEIPHPCASNQRARGTNNKLSPSSPRESQLTGYREAQGSGSEYPGRGDTPSPTLKPRTFRIGTWNTQGSSKKTLAKKPTRKLLSQKTLCSWRK
jgi:hypothetical protein